MAAEELPFKAEYAKSGRAGCKLCKGNISKDSLRLAKMVQVCTSMPTSATCSRSRPPPLQSPFFDGKQPNWYHYSCFFKTCQPHSTAEISGFGTLRPPDQDRLREKVQGNYF